jgi:hypothetical protein
MVLPANMAKAVYNDPGIEQYRGNPLIEAGRDRTLLMKFEQADRL